MMRNMLAQEVTGNVTANVEPAREIVFLGMTAPQLFALGAGIAVGGALCYAGIKLYKNRVANEAGSLFKERRKLKGARELASRQEHISILDSKNVQEWFRDNHVEMKDAKLMLALPSDKTLGAVGYALNDGEMDIDKFIIQAVYDSKNGTIYKLRFAAFDSIESNLQAKLMENDGLVILDS